eukprot:CAMPEP_0204899660 /NCGR_PEP_ID=MMETSP1397-20131031/1983_1 /ASSEMBLY_ACC=CAM_ASM_000891 /TAXON_ID=49980 /ORGANISM="Climacostomum Climacostomum virens, Strain Stock W-24" /LENGTH=68 /DNA_ID=CAMNT_0052067641 /DNA_START=334 /DNA_END=540 /DNA_ORIENTATION=-
MEPEPVSAFQTINHSVIVSDYLSPIASAEHLHFVPPLHNKFHKSLPKTPKMPAKPAMARLWQFVQEDL